MIDLLILNGQPVEARHPPPTTLRPPDTLTRVMRAGVAMRAGRVTTSESLKAVNVYFFRSLSLLFKYALPNPVFKDFSLFIASFKILHAS